MISPVGDLMLISFFLVDYALSSPRRAGRIYTSMGKELETCWNLQQSGRLVSLTSFQTSFSLVYPKLLRRSLSFLEIPAASLPKTSENSD